MEILILCLLLRMLKKKKILIPAVNSYRWKPVDYKQLKEIYLRGFHDLIYEFYNITNIPILLNTSFNENEPIVQNPEEAIATFLRTKNGFINFRKIIVYSEVTNLEILKIHLKRRNIKTYSK